MQAIKLAGVVGNGDAHFLSPSLQIVDHALVRRLMTREAVK
jgi:hypothetical protein